MQGNVCQIEDRQLPELAEKPAVQAGKSMNRPRVILADDHGILVEALAALLEPEFDVVGRVVDGRALVAAAAELKPDAVVVDIAMPLLNGMEAAEQIRKVNREIRIVFLTMNSSPEVASEALGLGASAYLLKSCAASELAQAIRLAMRGRQYVTPAIQKALSEAFIDAPLRSRRKRRGLNSRQREVLQLLAEGRSMKEAGAILNVAERTIAYHKYRIKATLRLRSNAELLQYALRQQIACGSEVYTY